MNSKSTLNPKCCSTYRKSKNVLTLKNNIPVGNAEILRAKSQIIFFWAKFHEKKIIVPIHTKLLTL